MALSEEDLFGRLPAKTVKLEELSIEELEARIVTLREQIAQCEALITSKRASAQAADAFFRKPA